MTEDFRHSQGSHTAHAGQERRLISITEAARLHNVTRQAIYVAIKQKKLKATKDASRWTIDLADLENYRRLRYSRTRSMFNGELLFDNTKGYFSVNQVAKMLQVPAQKIYYATRVGLMKAIRKGAAWVIHSDDVRNYEENYLKRKRPVQQSVSQ
jgi:excisionase family DNA binding protein